MNETSFRKYFNKKIVHSFVSFFLIYNTSQAQIDYSYFKQTWCKCLPDSGVAASDTLIFRIKSEACKTKRYSETHIYSEEQEYTFKKNNRLRYMNPAGVHQE